MSLDKTLFILTALRDGLKILWKSAAFWIAKDRVGQALIFGHCSALQTNEYKHHLHYICLSKNQNQSWATNFCGPLAVTLRLHIASFPRIYPRCYLLNYLRLINHNLVPCLFFGCFFYFVDNR